MIIKTCTSCNNELPDNFELDSLCPHCGVKITRKEYRSTAKSFADTFKTISFCIGGVIIIGIIGSMIFSVFQAIFLLLREFF